MTGEHLRAQARRVVTGLDADGKSTVVSDELTTTRVTAPGFTVCDLWEILDLPTHVDLDDATLGTVPMTPRGQVYRLATFAPDSEWDRAAGYKDSLTALDGGGETHSDEPGGIAGLHQTDTVDMVTILSGEMYAVTETAETLMRPGDTVIWRGIQHTWSNRSDQPCTVVACISAAKR